MEYPDVSTLDFLLVFFSQILDWYIVRVLSKRIEIDRSIGVFESLVRGLLRYTTSSAIVVLKIVVESSVP
jgi:hypothetical protein